MLRRLLETAIVRTGGDMQAQSVYMVLLGLKTMRVGVLELSPDVQTTLLTAFERTIGSMSDRGITSSFKWFVI